MVVLGIEVVNLKWPPERIYGVEDGGALGNHW